MESDTPKRRFNFRDLFTLGTVFVFLWMVYLGWMVGFAYGLMIGGKLMVPGFWRGVLLGGVFVLVFHAGSYLERRKIKKENVNT